MFNGFRERGNDGRELVEVRDVVNVVNVSEEVIEVEVVFVNVVVEGFGLLVMVVLVGRL